MTADAQNGFCPSCMKPLASDAPADLCAHCILKLALNSAADDLCADDLQPEGFPKIPGHLLLEKVGEGGCGDVYFAEQILPLSREVAVKVIKPGMDSRQVIARFEAERQALAMMDHPSVASVLDAGTTEAGRPYFVMEYIDGPPITTYCDEHRLGIHERLDLFINVCHAIQHAHQKGLIHRDIKPSNILVTRREDRALPKVIDFGIAKAVGGDGLAETTFYTVLGGSLGTPAYMSPEQAGLGRGQIDTRTDVHGLGVLLYELLTGTLPFLPAGNSPADFEELRRLIREQDPPKPSDRLAAGSTQLEKIAAQRDTDTRRLVADLRGDLDSIIMMAMEKNPDHRYDSAADLARDLQCHLGHLPILARPQGSIGSLLKFARRHRAGVIVGTAFLAVILSASVVSTVAAIRARRAEKAALIEARKSIATSRFLEGVFRGVDPAMARGDDTKLLRTMLDQTSTRLATQLGGQPEVEAPLRRSFGWTYHKIGAEDEAIRHLRRAEALYRNQPDNSYDLGITLNLLTYCILPTDPAAAEVTGAEAYQLMKIVAADPHASPGILRDTANSIPAIGRVRMLKGDHEWALAMLRDWRDFQVRVLGGESLPVASILDIMSQCEQRRLNDPDRHKNTEELLRQSLAIREKLLDSNDLELAVTRARLGEFLVNRHNHAEAAPLLSQSLEDHRRLLGSKNNNLFTPLLGLARLRIAMGELDAAEALYQEIDTIPKRSREPNASRVNRDLTNLADLFEKRGEIERAKALRARIRE